MHYSFLRVRSHERWNELIPVWDFKPAWKQVLFTWSFISAAFQNDSIFWWICCRPFISGGAYIFYHPKWNFISVKMTDMKSIPALSFKCTCALNATSKSLRLFISFRVNYVHMKISCRFEISFWSKWTIWNPYKIHTALSFISPQFMWTKVKSWLHTEVRFSTEMKSHTGLSYFRLSCERALCKLYVFF